VRPARLLWILAALAWAACWGGGEDGAQNQAQRQRTPPVAPEQAEVDQPKVEYTYDPTDKPDPFRSFVKELNKVKAQETTTPLERFDLSQLHVTAMIWAPEHSRALVVDPSGKGYIVGEGTPIGKNEGRIVGIDDGVVVVRERYVDFEGQATTKNVEMRLVGR